MVGATANEFTSMGGFGAPGKDAYVSEVRHRYGERADEFLALYPADSDEAAQQARTASQTDLMFAGMRTWAEKHHEHKAGDVYVYYFDRRLPGRNSEHYGAFHSGDLYYAFGTLASTERPWEDADYALADAMTSYWASFAADGNPNVEGLPKWPAYDANDPQVMELGERVSAMPLPKRAMMDFLGREIDDWLQTM
jgi:para-nitrobenzyl esterase